jgi:hypothetical protein
MRPLRCLLGRHKWVTAYNDDREPFLVCSRCHRDGPGARDKKFNMGDHL